MPTLVDLDNFLHREFTALTLPTAADRRIWSTVSRPAGVTYSTTYLRDGRGFMKITGDGVTSTDARRGIPAGNRIVLCSFYFLADAVPNVLSDILETSGPTNNHTVEMATDGTIHYNVGGSGDQSFAGSKADGLVHRLDVRFNTSGTTSLIDVSLDGVAGTQCSVAGQTAADITSLDFFGTATSTWTCYYQDVVYSFTSADHPLGAHLVKTLHVNGDGTHAATIVAGDFDKASGADILTSTTDAWTEIDDWITGAADTTTYIQDTAGATTEYTEHTFDDTTESTIWGVVGYAACFASATTACELGVQIVDSGGANVAQILNIQPTGDDVSETTLRFWRKLISANPTQSAVNAYKVRIGQSDDVAPDPRCSAVMLQIAVPTIDPKTLSGSLFTKAPTFFTGKVNLSLSGSLFVKTPTFFTGTISLAGGGQTLNGALFTKAPSFFAGKVNISLAGILFSKAPSFFVGKVNQSVIGVLFSKSPTFFTGQVNRTVIGALFSRAPTFFSGAISITGGPQTLTGVLFTKAPTFAVGKVNQSVIGVLFIKAPTFPQGQLRTTQILSGVLFTKAGTFYVGLITAGVLGKPVADPQARDLAAAGGAVVSGTQGEAVLASSSGDAILTPVDG
jgi:hypothetical protein